MSLCSCYCCLLVWLLRAEGLSLWLSRVPLLASSCEMAFIGAFMCWSFSCVSSPLCVACFPLLHKPPALEVCLGRYSPLLHLPPRRAEFRRQSACLASLCLELPRALVQMYRPAFLVEFKVSPFPGCLPAGFLSVGFADRVMSPLVKFDCLLIHSIL